MTFWVLLGALACALAGAPAALAAPLLPDVVSDAPEADGAPDVQDDGQGARLLLRLDGFVHNAGRGALEIRGANPSNRVMGTVRQRVYDSASGSQDIPHAPAPSLIYETNDEHRHWHLMHAMRYSLWSEDRSVEVAPVQKVGFCLEDSESVEDWASNRREYTSDSFCAWGDDRASSVVMGVSPGWRDVYGSGLAFQWVDISDTAPGRYWLRADADPDGVIAESDEVNPPAYESDMSIVDGHRADPVAAGTVPALGSTLITLAATTFADSYGGAPGPRQFQIVTPPAGGTLDQPTGVWFSTAQVHYTPKPGFSGPDTFTFAARDASSPFPRTPPSAAVTLAVAGSGAGALQPQSTDAGVLGISGAPRSVYTSSTTRLRATGPGVAQGVTWSASAGAGSAGRISASGVYRAPASVPRGGTVTIGARSATGASGKVTIRVRAKPRRRAAPGLKAPPVPKRGLSKIRLGRHSRSLLATVSSAQSGRVRFTMKRDGKRFGSCSMVVRKGGAATCTARIPARISRLNLVCLIPRTVGLKLPGVTVTATLIRHGKVVAKRYATAR